MMRLMLRTRALAATCLCVLFFSGGPLAQPLPVNYTVRLASATVYDTRSRGDDTAYAALSVFVNGNRTGTAIWDGKGWDGSRMEGRAWASGLHVFGTPSEGTVHVPTGRLQETDTVQIVFQILNSTTPPSSSSYESAAGRIQRRRAPEEMVAAPGSAWLRNPRTFSLDGRSPAATGSSPPTSWFIRPCSSDARPKQATPSLSATSTKARARLSPATVPFMAPSSRSRASSAEGPATKPDLRQECYERDRGQKAPGFVRRRAIVVGVAQCGGGLELRAGRCLAGAAAGPQHQFAQLEMRAPVHPLASVRRDRLAADPVPPLRARPSAARAAPRL